MAQQLTATVAFPAAPASSTGRGAVISIEAARRRRSRGRAPRDVIRVLVIGRHAISRAGLRRLLEANAGVEVSDEAATARDAARLLRATDPDVVLVDADGVEPDPTACSCMPDGPVPVLVLTACDADDRLLAALRAGAAGVLSKDSPPASLVSAVRTLGGGGTPRPPRTTRRPLEERIDSTATIVPPKQRRPGNGAAPAEVLRRCR
jgi:DNA-binding NarL/FixJ family response regulator